MKISYNAKQGKFIARCSAGENALIEQMPDRRWRRASRTWGFAALRRNIQYMKDNLNIQNIYTEEAWAIFVEKVQMLDKPVPIGKFPSWYKFKNIPMAHQQKGLDKWYNLDYAAILFEQGLGKTFTSINLVSAWRMDNQIRGVVVICPTSIKMVWADELAKHCPIQYDTHTLVSGKYKQAQHFIDFGYDFPWLMVGIEGLSQGKAYDYVLDFAAKNRCAVIIDESSGIKTPNKIRTDKCVKLGLMVPKRIIMSGTSLTQGVEDFYTQYKFLDPNILGYDSFYSYRAQYCNTYQMELPNSGRTVTKISSYKNEGELVASVMHCTERVTKKEAVDLPEKVFTARYVTMTKKQKQIYEDMKEELVYDAGDDDLYEVDTVLEQRLRLQQITGGHYPWDDGEKVVATPIDGPNPKINELISVLDETQDKCLVWCQFRPEIELVKVALTKAGIKFVEFHGGIKEDEKRESKERFMEDPSIKVFLCTRAASRGLTLTVASTAIYYSQGYSLEDRLQSQDRIHRIGQKNQCTYIDLLCNRTVDVEIMQKLAIKSDTVDMVYSLMKD